MNVFTKRSPLTGETLKLLLEGAVPEGFEDVEGEYFNKKTAPKWARQLIYEGVCKIQEHCSRKNARNPNPQAREIQAMSDTADQLTHDLVRAGWKRWQATVHVRSKEECAEAGVRYRPYRFAVRVWRSPEGEIILSKLQLEGKTLPEECQHCLGRGTWPAPAIYRAVGSGIHKATCLKCRGGGVWS